MVVKKQKVYSLTGRIDKELMLKAFKAVKRNRGVSGIDKMSVQLFENQLQQNLDALMKKMKSGIYSPLPLRRVFIPKGNNSLRPLGIPSVRDRVAQEVIRRLLEPIFEPMFHDCSFGFRKGRCCHDAIRKLKGFQKQGYKFVLDADIKAFFDNIPHKLIMELVSSEIADGNILTIIEKFLKSGVIEDGKFIHTSKGTPQGGVISPLLANITLNKLDYFLEENGFKFVRYADDFVVLCKSHTEAERGKDLISSFLNDELSLSLATEKTNITNFKKGFNFLGFDITFRGAKMRDKSLRKFKDKVRKLTIRHENLDKKVIVKLNQVIRGTVNYFCTDFSKCKEQFKKLDCWIRMRIRSMKFKRISRCNNRKFRNKTIHKLGLLSMVKLYSVVKEPWIFSPT